jgi:hypothetical protein
MNVTYMYRALCKNTVFTKQQQHVKMGPSSSDCDDSDESQDSTKSKEGSSSSMEETLRVKNENQETAMMNGKRHHGHNLLPLKKAVK